MRKYFKDYVALFKESCAFAKKHWFGTFIVIPVTTAFAYWLILFDGAGVIKNGVNKLFKKGGKTSGEQFDNFEEFEMNESKDESFDEF